MTTSINDQEAKKYIDDAFEKLSQVTSIYGITQLIDEVSMRKNRMNDDVYPALNFGVSKAEIDELMASKILDDDHAFSKKINDRLTDPLTKLLYATAWKNGDLPKIKHIIKGILKEEDESNEKKAIVFHQFGRYLTRTPGQPIIDQHVIRAFGIFKPHDGKKEWNVAEMRRLSVVDKKHNGIIAAYKTWLASDGLSNELRQCENYTYHVDKLLFALGKTVKYAKNKA